MFFSTRPVPRRPLTVPPMVYLVVVQVMSTLVIAAPPTVPVRFATLQDCHGFVGWVVVTL